MQTKIFTSKDLEKAAQLIKEGELVAFPTETVYGLGADALNPEAVKKIFIAKNRPGDNPLIVHISNKEEINKLAKDIPEIAYKLINNFWPGPLAIILKKKEIVPKEVTASLDTVAIRMPDNKIALKLIKLANPIAAPSANISSKPSSTKFDHVYHDFKGKIAGIIKSTKTKIGLESTVVDLTTDPPLLLRPGGLSFEEIKKVIPELEINTKNQKETKSPGMKYKHYSPEAKIILFEKSAIKKIDEYKNKFKEKKVKVIISNNAKNIAKNIFNIFRQADKDKVDYILITAVEEKGIGLALMNRLRKAATGIIN